LLGATGCDPTYLAVDGARPLGLLAMHWTAMLQAEGPVARITALVVDERERRRQIGGQLLEHAVAVAQRAGCVGIELTTALDRAGAHRFYRANGFIATSLRFSREIVADR
jgi:aminoglycoside 6'-N-acetyltransferase I